jgi:hypothetical protein
LGPAQANGQGQSQGHRRRRRRRKNKSSQQGTPQAQQPQAQPAQPQSAPPQAAAPRPASARQNQVRKKKKFFQKGSAPAAQPGNSVSAPPQGRHKERQKSSRGPRTFVGPMDHSYRAVNGNISEGPPSTIQISSGNGHGSYYPDAYQEPAQAVARPDGPTRIYCFIEDLFFQAKIQETSRKLGVKVEFVKGDKETLTRLTGVTEAERPSLLVFDLNNLNAKPITLIPKFKAKLKKATSIIGFLNHLQGDLKLKAVEAGCDTVMPRSAFSQSLPNLLRRYGLEEEEDYEPQPA